MKKIVGVRTLKTGIAATIAILLAQAIGLSYTASAGIIAILSVQNTRKESIQVAIRRLIAALVALLIGALCFNFGGYHAIVFGVYLIIFIPVASRFKVQEGIVPASVLVTHLLGEQSVGFSLIVNEVGLMLVGAGVALILNLYMPSIEIALRRDKRAIEEEMYGLLMQMAQALEENIADIEVADKLERLEVYLKSGKEKAHQNANNTFFTMPSPYEKYFDMRVNQYQVLLYMLRHFEHFFMTVEQGALVAKLTRRVAESVKGKIAVEILLKELSELKQSLKQSDLPRTREEFENRAMLYQFLNDIEQFLDLKKRFKSQLTDKEREEYNSYYDYNETFDGK